MNTTIASTSRTDLAKTAVYFTAFIAIGLASAVLGPTLPDLAKNTGVAIGEIGFLFTARSLGFLLGSTVGARLYDRFAGHRVMAIMIVGISLTLAVVPVTFQIWVLTAVLLLMGFVESLVDIGGNTLIVWVHRHKVGPFMNGLHFFFGVGAFLSPILVAQSLLRSEGTAWAYWLLALVILPVAMLVVSQPSPEPIAKDNVEESTGKLNYTLIGLISLFFFIYVGIEVGFGGWIFTYATTLGIVEEEVAAYLTSAFWGALTVGRLISIPIAASVRPRIILFVDFIVAAISMVVLLTFPNSTIALWIGVITFGIAIASVFPTILSFAERRMIITGQITGLFFAGASLGGMTLPLLMGYLLENISPIAVAWAVLIGIMLGLSLIGLILWQSNRA